MIKLLLLALVYGCVRGCYQGIIMHKPNCRDHRWYAFYHRTMVLDSLLAAIFAIRLDRLIGIVPTWEHLPYMFGLLLVGWETFELSYSWTRYSVLIPYRENFFGINFILMGWELQALHIGRIVLAAILIGVVV